MYFVTNNLSYRFSFSEGVEAMEVDSQPGTPPTNQVGMNLTLGQVNILLPKLLTNISNL